MFIRRGRPVRTRGFRRWAAVAVAGTLLVSAPAWAQGSGADGSSIDRLLLALVVILVGAKLAGELFQRLKQPAVLGEILWGILLGNLGLLGFRHLDYLRADPAVRALSELGVILLLFEVGLESEVAELRRVGLSALLVAALGVTASFGLVTGAARLLLSDRPLLVPVFLGAALCATSVGITARVLRDLGRLQSPEARTIIGAAVIDDVLGLVALAVVAGIAGAAAGGRPTGGLTVVWVLAKSVGFLAGALVLGSLVSPRLFRMASYLHVQHMLLVTSLGLCFLLAWLASAIGLAPIIGAFAAGLILDPIHYQDFRERGEHTIEELIRPIGGFLIPIFFVMVGIHVDLAVVLRPQVAGLAAVLVVAAVLGKQACSVGVLERGARRLAVGVGMIPRGEVSLIIATMGLTLFVPGAGGTRVALVTPDLFGAVVLVVLATTLVTPSLLKAALRGDKASPSELG